MKQTKEAVIFDIDGTLSDNEHRVHHLQGEKKDWDAFFAAQPLDTPRQDVLDVLCMYERDGCFIFLLTGRGEEWRDMTEAWLAKYNIHYDVLVMRPLGDRTDDDILKLEQIKAWQAEGFNIVGLFDDRMRICEAARNHGITVFQMARGEF